MNSEHQNIAIKAENITKSFGDFIAVDHISFEVKKGEMPQQLQKMSDIVKKFDFDGLFSTDY